jgi:predicted transcriptional regulator of viral defense system
MPGECREAPNSQGVLDSRTVWRRIATVAGWQHGTISHRQLLAAGLSAKAVEYRLRSARLHRVHRGVYAVGHSRLSKEGRWMAATLTVPGAVLSHGSTAARWELRAPGSGAIHVTASRRAARRRSIVFHCGALPADERTIRGGVPTTTLARTPLDLAATKGEKAFERALREATRALGVRGRGQW